MHLSGYQIAKAEIDFTYNSHVHLVHFNTVYSQKTMHFVLFRPFFFSNVPWTQQSVPPQIRAEVHADDAHNNVFAGLFFFFVALLGSCFGLKWHISKHAADMDPQELKHAEVTRSSK